MTAIARSKTSVTCLVVFGLAVFAWRGALGESPDAASARATRLLEQSGFRGGLVVHLGCGDGRLTAALHAEECYLVHGLDADEAKISAAREHINSLGLYGKVCVEQWESDLLPYVDNVVRLLVAEDLGGVDMEEVLRVLCPDGVALVEEGGEWRKTVKPRPNNIDDWTHYLHDPSNNAVAEDTVIGPPRRVQWVGGPRWTRDHNMLNSISSVVTAGGRLFFILDQTTGSTMTDPGQWALVARDAFNGLELWRKPIVSWFPHPGQFRSGPPQPPRLLAASREYVYVPLELGGPVSRVDSQTGDVLATYEASRGAEEILLLERLLLALRSTSGEADPANDKGAEKTSRRRGKSIVAVDTESGETLWEYADLEGHAMPETLASDGKHVCIQVDDAVVCLELGSGKKRWVYGNLDGQDGARKPPTGFGKHVLVISSDVVLCNLEGQLIAISMEDGEKLWSCKGGQGFHAPLDVFVIDGIVWTGNHPKDSISPPPVDDFSQGRDLHTGEVKYENSVIVDLQSVGHHHRCYRNKASSRYIMTGKRGIEMFEIAGNNHSRNNWVRGTCQYGIMPANGLIYAPPHSCGCYVESMVRGFYAMAPEYSVKAKAAFEARKSAVHRLSKGPAYETVDPAGFQPEPEAWPMFRHDSRRSGVAPTEIPHTIGKRWEVSIGGRLCQPVIADGKVIVSAVDQHQIHAFDGATGKPSWSRTVGGRVDSPPAIHRGLVIFGSADGSVYCLRLADGALVWRFLAAPADLRTVSWRRLESVWPVHGSVLIANDTVYFSAGRSSWLDNGIDLYGLDPATGKLLHHYHYESDQPKFREGIDRAHTVREEVDSLAQKVVAQLKAGSNRADYKSFLQADRSVSFSMAGGTVSDILVGDGRSVYLHQIKFGLDLALKDEMSPHLFSTSGFLDDAAEDSRTHWVLGEGDFSLLPYPYVAAIGRKSEIESVFGMTLAYDEHSAWSLLRKRPYSKDHVIRVIKTAIDDKSDVGTPQDWQVMIGELRPKSILKAGEDLWVGGLADDGAKLLALSAEDGRTVATVALDVPMAWDGMAAADGCLYMSRENGSVACFGEKTGQD